MADFVWTSTSRTPPIGVEGQIADRQGLIIETYTAEDAIRYGLFVSPASTSVLRGHQVRAMPALPAVSLDEIATAIASSLSGQVLTTTGAGALNGTTGLGRILPARALRFTFSASAHWDGVLGHLRTEVYFRDASGNIAWDSVVRNNVGASEVTVDTARSASSVIRIDVGAGTGVAGTLRVGTTPNNVELGRLDGGIAIYDPAKEPSATSSVSVDAGKNVRVLRRGRAWALPKTDVAVGDPVTVRVVAAGPNVRGELGGVAALTPGGSFAPLLGAYWATAASAGNPAMVEMF